MNPIKDLKPRIVFNSLGETTIEVEVIAEKGKGRFAPPSGTSKGRHEVVDYPPGGVEEAVKIVKEVIAPKLIGMDVHDQESIDKLLHELDGTDNFRRIGGNTAYAISVAVAEASARSEGIPLFMKIAGSPVKHFPLLIGNIISGGSHIVGTSPNIQEFLVLAINASSIMDSMKANVSVGIVVKRLLKERGVDFHGGRSMEGAWIADLKDEEALEILSKACEIVSEETGIHVKPAIDLASTSLWDNNRKGYVYKGGKVLSPEEQLELVVDWIERYSLCYVEDPFHEDAFEDFSKLMKRTKKCLICGDDLFVTNKSRLMKGIQMNSANAVIIKPNQVGTLTDAKEVANLAERWNITKVASHRSRETVDNHLAHIAIGLQCPLMKIGIAGGERISKINELIRVSEAEEMKPSLPPVLK